MSKERLLLATTNKGKAKEIESFLSEFPFKIFTLQEVFPKQSFVEEGNTFAENARGKSLFYSHQWEDLILAEDSGLEIEHLKGAPGVLSARFSWPQPTDEKNIRKVLDLMEGVPLDKRKARFVSCIVLSQKGKIIKEIKENVTGLITYEKKGSYGFGYDPIFYYPPLKKTLAELLPEEKNSVSHRGRALKKLKEYLVEAGLP
ncbi:MAG: RdgB/HAM1 family non-canonical purine NTP pyrophosphatase [Candidatus Aminicenantes bacterium]|nr:MAG: RdgB/HAM1 family non-canonical purine NTP pyrophosphatase [Candidatus Aminicenantes bacterium]